MSNHFSAAGLKHPGDDARLDLTDLFVFTAPGNPDRTVLIMNSNPFTKGDGFHPGAVYRFNIDTDGDALADAAFSFTFSPYDNGRQTATAYYATGADAQTREPRGEVLIEAAPVGFDATATPVQAGPLPQWPGHDRRCLLRPHDLHGPRAGHPPIRQATRRPTGPLPLPRPAEPLTAESDLPCRRRDRYRCRRGPHRDHQIGQAWRPRVQPNRPERSPSSCYSCCKISPIRGIPPVSVFKAPSDTSLTWEDPSTAPVVLQWCLDIPWSPATPPAPSSLGRMEELPRRRLRLRELVYELSDSQNEIEACTDWCRPAGRAVRPGGLGRP